MALRKKPSTTTMRTNEVVITKIAGAKETTVKTANSCIVVATSLGLSAVPTSIFIEGIKGAASAACDSASSTRAPPSSTTVFRVFTLAPTVIKDGYFGDNSKMYIVGETSIRSRKLCEAAQEALYVGLRAVKPGSRLNEIGKAVQKYTESQGFSVVREYCGHGIGTEFHSEPQVLHYYADDGGVILQKGMVFTIEPMINAGKKEVRLMGDGWTVKTKDRSHSAQYEHQIVVTDSGCEVMTIRPEEEQEGRIQRIMVNC